MTDHKGYVKMARTQGVCIKARDDEGNAIGPARLVKPSDSDKAIVQAINNHYFGATASRDANGNIDKKKTNANRVIEKEDYRFENGVLQCCRHTDKQLYKGKWFDAYVITPSGTCTCPNYTNTGLECKHVYWAKIYFPEYFGITQVAVKPASETYAPKTFVVKLPEIHITDEDIKDI